MSPRSDIMKRNQKYQRFYEIISRIPAGKVATYGQIALLAGFPGHARQVGYALNALPDDLEIPWQRVINAKVRLAQERTQSTSISNDNCWKLRVSTLIQKIRSTSKYTSGT